MVLATRHRRRSPSTPGRQPPARLPTLAAAIALLLLSCTGADSEVDEPAASSEPATPVEGSSASATSREIQIATGSTIPLGLDGPPLAVVVDEGGLCEGGPCRRVLELSAEGDWLLTDATGVSTTGAYDAAQLAELARSTDSGSVILGEFAGECPTAFDGAERSYVVFSPDEPDARVLDTASCLHQLDAAAPVLVALDLLITDAAG